MSDWQPIETAHIAPFNKEKWYLKHSDYFLLWAGHVTIGAYGYTERGKGRWQNHLGNINPTHWMQATRAAKMISLMQRLTSENAALRLKCKVQTWTYWPALAAVVGVAIYKLLGA